MKCLLCTKKADSLEHYIPTWLSDGCEANSIEVVRGKSTGASFSRPEPLGPMRNAKSRILCEGCNKALGRNIEGQVKNMLLSHVSPQATADTIQVDGDLLAKWMILRALEASVVLKESLLSVPLSNEIVRTCQSARDGTTQAIWPLDAGLEAVFLRHKTLGCAISRSFISTERGSVKSAASGFWFFLQMNRLGLLLLHAPNSQRNNSQGYGLKLFPPGAVTVNTRGIRTNEVPSYDSIREVYQRLTLLNTEE